MEEQNYPFTNNLKINEIKNYFHERALSLKNHTSLASDESLETNFNQTKSIVDDLRDYEVIIINKFMLSSVLILLRL